MQRRWMFVSVVMLLLGTIACTTPAFLEDLPIGPPGNGSGGSSDEGSDEEADSSGIPNTEFVAEPVIVDGQLEQWAVGASATSQFTDDGWSAQQVVGIPNVFGCGDDSFAWASADQNGVDSITLRYSEEVIPRRIDIYETYNPGAIERVTVIDETGSENDVYTNNPATTTECPRLLRIPVDGIEAPIDTVVIYLDQTNHPSWNEIDAVQLVGLVPE